MLFPCDAHAPAAVRQGTVFNGIGRKLVDHHRNDDRLGRVQPHIGGALDRDAFRLAATEARAATGLKGRALFHPIRVALTAADSGPELDLAVPAIDRGAAIESGAGIGPVLSCAERAKQVVKLLD